jgi:hypothetical protein
LRRGWSVLGRYRLITGGWRRLLRRNGRLLVAITEQTAEEAGGMRGLRALLLDLLKLLLKLAQLSFGLVKGDVLHENRLREHVQGVRISGEALVQKGLCFGIFFLEGGLVEPIDEGVKKLVFLRSHESNLRRSFVGEPVRLS